MKQKIKISLVAGIIVGLWLAYIMYHSNSGVGAPDIDTIVATGTQSSPATTSPANKKKIVTMGGVTFETDADNPGGISLEQLPVRELPKPIPALSATVDFSNSPNVGSDVQVIIKTQITELVRKLSASPGDLNNWLSLGLYRKMANEYSKAREAWEYAKKLAPADKQAYNNLGDLYQYYLKNYLRAEENWKKTIELDTKFITGYRSLYDLYVQNNQKAKAKAIIESGLAKNPNSLDLLILLANYYKDLGDKEQAKTYFIKALAEAKSVAQNTNMAPILEAEIEALK